MRKSAKKKPTADGMEILKKAIARGKKVGALLSQASVNAEVAELIYHVRTKHGLSQGALGRRVGTTQSVIARLEDADYQGHSLTMLRRVADALGYRVEIKLAPKGR